MVVSPIGSMSPSATIEDGNFNAGSITNVMARQSGLPMAANGPQGLDSILAMVVFSVLNLFQLVMPALGPQMGQMMNSLMPSLMGGQNNPLAGGNTAFANPTPQTALSPGLSATGARTLPRATMNQQGGLPTNRPVGGTAPAATPPVQYVPIFIPMPQPPVPSAQPAGTSSSTAASNHPANQAQPTNQSNPRRSQRQPAPVPAPSRPAPATRVSRPANPPVAQQPTQTIGNQQVKDNGVINNVVIHYHGPQQQQQSASVTTTSNNASSTQQNAAPPTSNPSTTEPNATLKTEYNADPNQTRVWRNGNQVWSDVPSYSDPATRTLKPDDLPARGSARTTGRGQTAQLDSTGRMKGFDGESYRMSENALQDNQPISLIHDQNQDSRLVVNGEFRSNNDGKRGQPNSVYMSKAAVGLGDDLQVEWEAKNDSPPQYAYNGQEPQAMVAGQYYYANDGGYARYYDGRLQVRNPEYDMTLQRDEKNKRALTLQATTQDRTDGYGLGMMGVTTAPGRQMTGRNQSDVDAYARLHARPNALTSDTLADHSSNQGLGMTGDTFAKVEGRDYQTYYTERYYQTQGRRDR